MSYTKDMIALARDWLAANPKRGEPIVSPRRLESLQRSEDLKAKYELARKIFSDPTRWAEGGDLRNKFDELAKLDVDYLATVERLDKICSIITMPQQTLDAERGDTRWTRIDGELGQWCLAWGRDGYNVMELSPDFTAAMLMTDSSVLDLSKIRLPFGGILMLIPDKFITGSNGNSYTKLHLSQLDHIARITGEPRDDMATEEWVKQFTLSDEPGIMIIARNGQRLITLVAPLADLSWQTIEALPAAATPDTKWTDEDKHALHVIRQLVFATLGYVNATPSSITPKDRTGPRKAQPAQEPVAQQWNVGRDVKIDKQLVQAARRGSHHIAFRIQHRHIVRGHYRNQACGPGLTQRKQIWIQPFWRGPEEGAKIVHTYKPEAPSK